MNYVYLKPELENLSQGERISFARQMRRMTQDEVSEKLGLTGECKRRSMTRYERGDRIPKEDRLLEIAKILNVNVKCLKEFYFRNDEDMIYMLLWMVGISEYFSNRRDKIIQKFMNEWKEMRRKRQEHEITYDEYIEWKLQYEFNKGDEYEENS